MNITEHRKLDERVVVKVGVNVSYDHNVGVKPGYISIVINNRIQLAHF